MAHLDTPTGLDQAEREHFAAVLKARMDALGVTPQDLAEQFPWIKQATVYRWLSGKTSPRTVLLERLCDLLGLTGHEITPSGVHPWRFGDEHVHCTPVTAKDPWTNQPTEHHLLALRVYLDRHEFQELGSTLNALTQRVNKRPRTGDESYVHLTDVDDHGYKTLAMRIKVRADEADRFEGAFQKMLDASREHEKALLAERVKHVPEELRKRQVYSPVLRMKKKTIAERVKRWKDAEDLGTDESGCIRVYKLDDRYCSCGLDIEPGGETSLITKTNPLKHGQRKLGPTDWEHPNAQAPSATNEGWVITTKDGWQCHHPAEAEPGYPYKVIPITMAEPNPLP